MHIHISIATQTLVLFDNDTALKRYIVSTAKNGCGEIMGSECTPRGRHIVAQKIGADCALNTVFIGRVPTGEMYTPDLRERYSERDWILTRILWLRGTESGKNTGQKNNQSIDSHERYIYIHGSPEDVEMGKPGSRGCIRMHNQDVIELFNDVQEGTIVEITET